MNFVDQYFTELDKKIKHPVKIILTGAMAGIILGNIRPSMNIDFEIEFCPGDSTSEKSIAGIESAIAEVSKKLNLPAQYSESIQGWSMISLLDYRESAVLYKKIGKIEVRVLSPEYWSIGKMARYVELDEMDLLHVLQKHPIAWRKMTAFWGKALKNSARSDRSREFRDHVVDFIKRHGKKIWGDSFEPNVAIEKFKASAGIH